MIDALSIAWRSLKDLWEEVALLIMLDLLWSLAVVLAAAPFFGLGSANLFWALALSLLFGLPLPILSGAICFVTNQITRGVAVGWHTFGEGIRRYWVKGLVVALINLVVLILIGANLRFYVVVFKGIWANFALSIWLVIAIYWLLAQLFWFPMILELKSENLLVALRNALAMVIITPGFTVSVGLIVVVISAVSIVLTVPAVFLLASLLLLIANHATRSRLARLQKKPYTPGAQESR